MIRRLVPYAICAVSTLMPTIARSETLTHWAGTPAGNSTEDGPAASARFNYPVVAIPDGKGGFLVADYNGHTIRQVSSTGSVSTWAGSMDVPGSQDGPRQTARFRQPTGLALDPRGSLFVLDYGNHTIRKIAPDGTVSTFAGLAGVPGSLDGKGSAARFNGINRGIVIDGQGTIYISDTGNHTVRKITPEGDVSTLAGSAGQKGSADGTGGAARFNSPRGLSFDGQGNLLVADTSNFTIRRITPAGVVTTVAGRAGESGCVDGPAATARFMSPRNGVTDSSGNILVADMTCNAIRKIAPDGLVSTIAGAPGGPGTQDGTGSAARFDFPSHIAPDGAGAFLVPDAANGLLRRVTQTGTVTTIAGPNTAGSTDGTGLAIKMWHPQQVNFDTQGNLLAVDSYNCTIRSISPQAVSTTIAGMAGSCGFSGEPGNASKLAHPTGVAADAAGNVYIADWGDSTVKKLTPAGVLSTLAGRSGQPGHADGTGGNARLGPSNLAVDGAGNVYVTEADNKTIRKITPAGAVTTLAGSAGLQGSVDGTGAAARFDNPVGIALDRQGTLWVTDSTTVRSVSPAGVVRTVAGGPGTHGWADGEGSAARFSGVFGIGVEPDGNIMVSEVFNNLVRRVTPSGTVTTLAGKLGLIGSREGTGSFARITTSQGLAVDSQGRGYIAQWSTHAISLLTPSIPDTATIDQRSGPIGIARQLDCKGEGATAWNWRVTQRPPGSAAQIDNPNARRATFTPDVPGPYQITLKASNASGIGVSLVGFFAGGNPLTLTRTIPIVLDAAGRGEARYASELVLANRGAIPASVTLAYRASLGAGTGSVEETLPAGGQLVIPDAIAYLRQKGLEIPPEQPQGGALRVTFSGLSSLEAAFASARTTAPTGPGRAGLAYPGLTVSEASGSGLLLYGLRQNGEDRTNLAMVNMASSGDPITLRVSLANGMPAAGRPSSPNGFTEVTTVTLEPGEWKQIAFVLNLASLTNGFALIERISGTGPFTAYAVFNNNATNDGSYVEGIKTDRAAGELLLPVIVETPSYQSELILVNPGTEGVTVSMTYQESLDAAPNASPTVTDTLAAGEQKIIPGATAYLRTRGAAIGAAGGSFAGPLRISFKNAAGSITGGFAAARTGSPASGAVQYGLFYPALTADETAEEEALVFGLVQNDTNRANLALINASSTGPVSLHWELRSGGSGAVVREGDVTLEAGRWTQINGILGPTGEPNGYARITRTSGSGRFAAYGVVNDGNVQPGTNDGSYIAMSVVQ